MKGKIDVYGCLEIERAGVMKEQYCPYAIEARCGDYCPKFREPRLMPETGRYELDICEHLTLFFDEFEDERVEP